MAKGQSWIEKAKLIGLIVLIVLVVIVVIKNSQQTTFWFFGWNVTMPKALMLFVIFVLGAIVGAGGFVLRGKRK